MPVTEFGREDCLLWRFVIVDGEPEFSESPATRFDPPVAWVNAVVAVARDLRCLRCGPDIHPHLLVWELSIDEEYTVTIGWNGTSGISGFASCGGRTMEATFTEAAIWIADTAQTELAGYDFVQWPSGGRYLLAPRLVGAAAVWLDPRTGRVVAQIGELCVSGSA